MAVAEQHTSLASTTLRVLSYNVRYDSIPDNISVQDTLNSLPKSLPQVPIEYRPNLGELPWSTRRINVANDILSSNVHIYGGQELLRRQVDDLQELLGEDWTWTGVGRDDGDRRGEYSPIFYRRDIFTLHDWDTFWLSMTPFEHSKFPDAGSKRICTTAQFSVIDAKSESMSFKPTQPDFTILNTHLDDQSASQRQLGASLILHRAKFEAIKSKRPVMLTGDFNSPPNDSAYRIITGKAKPQKLNQTFLDKYVWTTEEEKGCENFVLMDLLGETPPHRRSGHYATFTDFAHDGDTTAFERLDYVFGGTVGKWIPKSYRVGSNIHDDGVYASDHRPVFADVCLDIDHGDKGVQSCLLDLTQDNIQMVLGEGQGVHT